MKKTSLFIILLGLLLIASTVFARTYTYPEGKPIFSIDFPDTWKVEFDTQDVAILAKSPDEEIEYNIWALPARQVKTDVTAALNDAVKDVNEIISQYVTSASFGDWHPARINEIEFIWAEGKGRYKEGGQQVYMEVDFFSPDAQTVYVLIYWGTREGEKKYKTEIGKIDRSIRKVK